MQEARLTFDELRALQGEELGVSDWVLVSQDMIDRFADCTGDRNWIHIDRERARRRSPVRTTIAHGYLTLSLVGAITQDMRILPDNVHGLFNWGVDKVRFLAPVKSEARIRVRVRLLRMEDVGPGQYRMTASNIVEIEGTSEPAMTAETTVVVYEKRERRLA